MDVHKYKGTLKHSNLVQSERCQADPEKLRTCNQVLQDYWLASQDHLKGAKEWPVLRRNQNSACMHARTHPGVISPEISRSQTTRLQERKNYYFFFLKQNAPLVEVLLQHLEKLWKYEQADIRTIFLIQPRLSLVVKSHFLPPYLKLQITSQDLVSQS